MYTKIDQSAEKSVPLGYARVFNLLLPFIKPYKLVLVGIFLALVFGAGALLSFGMALKYFINSGLSSAQVDILNTSVLYLLFITLVLAGAAFTRYYLSAIFSESVVKDIKQAVFKKLLTFSPSFFEDHKIGDIVTRLNTDATLIRSAMGAYASTGLRSFFQLLGAISMLFITSPKLTASVLVCIPLMIIPLFIMGKRVKKIGRTTQDFLGEEGGFIDETFAGIKTVQSFCRETLHRNIFDTALTDTLNSVRHYTKLRAIMVAIVICIIFSALSFLLWLGGREVINGKLTAGDLSAFVFFGVIAAASVNSLLELFGDIQRALAAAERLFEIFDLTPLIRNADKSYALPQAAKGSIRIQDLSFSYPSRKEVRALENVSFDVKPGEKVAIVGPSGAGKSTLFNLILRFYAPKSGGINIDEIDISQLSLSSLRSKIALVPQDPYIFNASIYDNIAYGKPHASPEDIWQAAEKAYVTEFVDTLPNKFDTIVGEKGVKLSGGQKQRLSIARAILKNPLILLLDEATNALDAESEHIVQRALDEVMKERTTLIVAHRLSTVQTADKILVLNEGKIASVGTHQTLIEEEGLYKRFASLQFGSLQQ